MTWGEWWRRWQQQVLYVVLTGLLVYGVWRAASNEMAQTSAKYEATIAQYRAQAEAAVTRSDSLLAVIAERQVVILRLEKQLAQLRNRPPDTTGMGVLRTEVSRAYRTLGDSVRTAFGGIIPKQQQLIVRQDSTIQWQGRVILKQDTLLAVKTLTIADLQASNATLRTALTQVPPLPPRNNKVWGWLPLPTRTQALVGGVVVGAAVGAVVTHQLRR